MSAHYRLPFCSSVCRVSADQLIQLLKMVPPKGKGKENVERIMFWNKIPDHILTVKKINMLKSPFEAPRIYSQF